MSDMKRVFICAMAIMLSFALLVGCGKEKKDYFMEGYEAVEAGRYKEALKNFEIAAKEGDDQAKKAAGIVSGYLNAKEAYDLGSIDSAKEILNDIHPDYKFYDIAADINTLRLKLYGATETKPSASATATADREDTKEDSVSEESTDAVEKEEVVDQSDFTSEMALRYLHSQYDIQGDLGDGALSSGTDADGEKYYAITIQVGNGDDMSIKSLQIYRDGRIEEIE